MKELFAWRFATPNIYLNGHPFHEFITSGTFERLGKYLDHGLCYEAAALMMFVLRNDKSATIVHGQALNSEKHQADHAWVEFKKDGVDYVTSPTWLKDLVIPKQWYYDQGKEEFFLPEPKWKCNYQRFWNQRLSKKLYEKCRDPNTSYILPALRFYRPDDSKLVHPDRRYGFVANSDPADLPLYQVISRGFLADYGGGYRKSLTSQIIEEIYSGAEDATFESVAEANAIRHRLWHRITSEKSLW